MFIGHRKCVLDKSLLKSEIEKLIKLGITGFLSGGLGEFDELSALCVHELKEKYPHICNILIIPYLSFPIFDETIFDEILYPYPLKKYYWKSTILIRNQYMVEHSLYAVCYVNRTDGGAAKTYRHAVKNHLHIINLA